MRGSVVLTLGLVCGLMAAAVLWPGRAPTASPATVGEAVPEGAEAAATPDAAAPDPDAAAGATPDAAAEPPAEAPPSAPTVTVTEADLQPNPGPHHRRVTVSPAPAAPDRPLLGASVTGPAANTLRRLVAEGRAAGHVGVFYDNRDRGHSRLSPERFPQLTHIAYAEPLRDRRLDQALAGPFLFDGPVLGNASMAVTGGPQARSLPRLAVTSAQGPHVAYAGYAANHLYVYPGHMDVRRGRDLLPATLPYFVVSRGSSRSDRPVLEALAMALAALPPETRARAEVEGLLAPLLTMILRRNLQASRNYLSAWAHPAAIMRDQLRPAMMVATAQSIAPDEIPPMVRLQVLSEDFSDAAGLAQTSERLFDTPSALGRLWRDWAATRQMELSAAATRDPNGRPLEFHWVLVSGDPGRVRITPRGANGQSARVEIDWHDAPFPRLPRGRSTARVEIAVIAWNGAHYSAPALVSVAFPAHQKRVHAPGPDGRLQLVSVDHDAAGREESFDPVLWYTAPWRDEAIRDEAGTLLGWRRTEGERVSVLTGLAPGHYRVNRDDAAVPRLVWTP